MDTGPRLIERAAALLRDNGSPTGPGRLEKASSPVSERAGPLRPFTRAYTLDHAAMAESGIIVPWSTTRRVVEEFRIVKGNVIANWKGIGNSRPSNQSPRTVMVTSAKPREGKTFASINLALSFAAEERLTAILIDADPVRGGVAKSLKIPARPGLTAILSGEMTLSDALIQTDISNLLVLPSGDPGAHIPELLTGGGAGKIFAELARHYPEHVIVIDTGPTLASTTPAGLAAMVGQIVFVIEAGQTQRAEIESAVGLLSGCRQISFLLNKAPPSSEHFGSYPYYGALDDASGKVASD